MVTARICPCEWDHSKALDVLDTIVGSYPLNGQVLATHGTITYQVQDFEATLRGYDTLVGTVKQVDIEKYRDASFSLEKYFSEKYFLIFFKST